ncbi:MAG: hypothetical protein U1F67_07845 [Rubrivivax sp.]
MLTAVLSVAGAFLVFLVAVAMTVAGWEWLRQRERLDGLRRDRAHQAATSPLPLMAVPKPAERAVTNRAGAPAAPTFGQAVAQEAAATATGSRPGPWW